MNRYDIGDLVKIQGTFTDTAGVPTNPTTATLRVHKPDGTLDIYTGAQLSSGGNGIKYVEITPALAGTWLYRWEGTGAVTTVEEAAFVVRKRRVPAA